MIPTDSSSSLYSEKIHANDSNNINDVTDTEINQQYCQSDRCKFLFAYYPPEQETQANQHFLSFVQLAEKLNRTMILTNVGNSHILACNSFPFDFYYDVEKLKRRFPNVKFITQKKFQ